MVITEPYFEDRDAVRETLATLHDAPSFMPASVIYNTFHQIITTSIIISTIYLIVTLLLRPHRKNEKDGEYYHLSFLATNFMVNSCLAVLGIYHMIYTLPDFSSVDETQRIIGYDHYLFFGIIQIGFNIWGLLVGYFIVNERPSMLAHHVAAMFVASTSVFFTNGFRYYAPFFLGAIEMSSVPLALINLFKRNKEWTKRHCQTFSTIVKLVFAASFLILRVYLWNPRMYDVLQISSLLVSTCDSYLCCFVVGGFAMCGVFLSIMQYYWSFLIVKGLIAIVTGGTSQKKKKTN